MIKTKDEEARQRGPVARQQNSTDEDQLDGKKDDEDMETMNSRHEQTHRPKGSHCQSYKYILGLIRLFLYCFLIG